MTAKTRKHTRRTSRTGLSDVWLLLTMCFWIFIQPLSLSAEQRLEILARVGPWPVVSNLIVYRDRLWFSSSVKGRNHNSADIWSLDPKSGELSYERHLFSQDAGQPLIFQGLLYWPHEDSRLSLAYGAMSVTDGLQWSELDIKTAQIFHVHQLLDWGGTLVAVTSAWRAGLQVSDDGGSSWSQFYDHPTPPKRVSRLQSPAVLLARLYFKLQDPSGIRLVRIADGPPIVIDDWPKQNFHALTAYAGSVYGIVGRQASTSIWRSNGRKSEQLTGLPQSGFPVDLYAGRDRLWALFAKDSGGYVASSKTGDGWHIEASFDGGRPHELVAVGEQLLVGGAGADGKAVVWGVKGVELPQLATQFRRDLPMPLRLPAADGVDWQKQADRLKMALQVPANFRNHGRGGLREIVRNILALSPPSGFLASHLNAPMPDTKVAVIGGEAVIPARQIGQWILLWGMRSDQESQVPAGLLKRAWSVAPKSSQKYFDPLLAALFTISFNRQNDHATIDALITRLESRQDPLWLQGDIIGTLNAITAEKFGYDIARWSQWWNHQRSN